MKIKQISLTFFSLATAITIYSVATIDNQYYGTLDRLVYNIKNTNYKEILNNVVGAMNSQYSNKELWLYEALNGDLKIYNHYTDRKMFLKKEN